MDAGIILNTVDGGQTWQVQLPATLMLKAVYFNSITKGYAVGFNVFGQGVIMRTTDGGENWETEYMQSSFLNDVTFIDDSIGWVVGDFGFIYNTANGGETWEQAESGTNADLNRLVFTENGETGYIFGDNNTLLKYDNTSFVNGNDGHVPLLCKLYQNYPNPFNPETVITYELGRAGFVNLKMYNLTGKEVITLINENQTVGNYQVVWNGRNNYGKEVSSGIYLCKLSFDNLYQTKKMILIR